MEKQHLLHILKELREKRQKRKFTQNIDLIFNLQGLDPKKQEQKLDFYFNLPHQKMKKTKICAIVDRGLLKQAENLFDKVILKEDVDKWKGKKKEQKKLAEEYDYIIAQEDFMTSIAAIFGKVLGSKGKMPNPKAGCVVSGTATLEPLAKKLTTLIRIQTKNDLSVKLAIGQETMNDEDLADNILALYNTVLGKLPQEKNNIRNVLIKLTMGSVFEIETTAKKQ